MKKMDNLQEALLNHRNTPPQGHSLSPAQMCFGRRTRGLLPNYRRQLVPNQGESHVVQYTIAMKRAATKFQYDKHAGDQLQPIGLGEFVYMKPSPRHKGGPWPYGVVAEIPTTRSYSVDTPSWGPLYCPKAR